MKSRLFLITFLFANIAVFHHSVQANSSVEGLSQSRQEVMKNWVGQYLMDSAIEGTASLDSEPGRCHPPSPAACVEGVCGKLSKYDCDTQEELKPIFLACRGNYGSGCLETVCSKLTRWDCDSREELFQITQACRGDVDAGCVDYVCEKMGRWSCDSRDEIFQVIQMCTGEAPPHEEFQSLKNL